MGLPMKGAPAPLARGRVWLAEPLAARAAAAASGEAHVAGGVAVESRRTPFPNCAPLKKRKAPEAGDDSPFGRFANSMLQDFYLMSMTCA